MERGKGVALCHNGTMHVTGNITLEMPRVLARGEAGARGGSNSLRKGREIAKARKREEGGGGKYW
jgi:hypothetical protein